MGTSGKSTRNPDEQSPDEQERKAIASDDGQPTDDLNAAVFRIHWKPSGRAILAESLAISRGLAQGRTHLAVAIDRAHGRAPPLWS